MRRKVVVTRRAISDLREIYLSIATDNISATDRVFGQLDSAIDDLALSSLHYPLLAELPRPDIRRRVVGSYNVFYRITDDGAVVDRILHGARDFRSELFPED